MLRLYASPARIGLGRPRRGGGAAERACPDVSIVSVFYWGPEYRVIPTCSCTPCVQTALPCGDRYVTVRSDVRDGLGRVGTLALCSCGQA